MKKLLIALVLLVGLLGLATWILRLSPTNLSANFEVGAGMGAKLGCSGRYISDLDHAEVMDDLASYSPVMRLFDLQYDDAKQQAKMSIFGGYQTTATFRPGLGCALDIGNTTPLDAISVPELSTIDDIWPRGNQTHPLNDELTAVLNQILRQDNEDGLHTRALLVAHQGQLVAEVYASGFDQNTPLLGWSMGKSLTSIMLGRLEATGRMQVSEQNLFEDWQTDERTQISVENLLQMSGGLDFSETYAPGSDSTKMLFTVSNAASVPMRSSMEYPPGSHFSYSSGSTNLLSKLLVDRLGGTQAAVDFLYDEIFRPLGMRHTTLEPDPSGVFVGSSYVYASARDWARLGQLMLEGGVFGGKQILTADWVSRSQQPNRSKNEPRYGYQFWLNSGGDSLRWSTLPEDAYAMRGDRGQSVMIIPSRQLVLVRLGWSASRYPMEQKYAQILDALEQLDAKTSPSVRR